MANAVSSRAILLIVILAIMVVVGILVYRSRSSDDELRVEPHAREEIEKAKRH